MSTLLLTLLGLYFTVAVVVWAAQRRILYAAAGRSDVPVPTDARALTLSSPDGVTVHAFAWDAPPGAPTVVYFHGNGEVIGDDVGIARTLVKAGLGVVLVEFRGYGHAIESRPTEAGLYLDAETVLASLASKGVGPSRVVLWGTSLGTGVAADMAARGRGSRLILVSPYSSMADVAAVHLPWLPVRILLKDRYETVTKAPLITVPTLIVHGTVDAVVPYALGERVAAAIGGARLTTIEGGGHNDLFVRPGVLAALAAFALGHGP